MKKISALAANTNIRPDVEQLRLITKVARLHYTQGARQMEIGKKLGISQAGVSRLLRLAEEYGIVRSVVVPPEGLYPDLEDDLVEAYGLDSAYVVDVGSSDNGIAQILGAAAARCLGHEFDAGPVIGFTSWSTTLREMARLLEPRHGSKVTHVVETLGDLGSPMLQHEADVATVQMAKSLEAEAVFLRAPGVMTTATLRNAAVADAHVQKAIRHLDKLDVVFVGVGPADFHGPLEAGDNFFSAKQMSDVRAAGAVGQLHQRFVDVLGQPIATPLDELVVGITLDQLRKAKRRIGVAGGKSKRQALAAALKGKWLDVLVTDVNSANYFLSAGDLKKGRT